MPPPPGTLFVVATPIGNLEDFTFRGLRTLREVDLIAAEDTRRTSKLLAHYEIRKPMVSVREHNEAREAERLIAKLAQGQNIAMVSDAGTPGIADPGARLVRAVRARGFKVVPIPGASAVAAALSVSGLEGSEFAFMGFPPPAGSERRTWFERLAKDDRILVFFEAPHRIGRTLADSLEYLVKRQIQIHREMTKINEEFVICNNNSAIVKPKEQGEFTVVVSQPELAVQAQPDAEAVASLFGCLTEQCSIDQAEAIRISALMHSVPERTITKLLKKHKISVKQSNRARA